ncbi:MAG TPA: hypothetical protein VNV88_12910 [Candidatus Solibacter sp.]|jgi:hypothetical protein|nr:hypothetical protein [Candidatus Solibacter sp.]
MDIQDAHGRAQAMHDRPSGLARGDGGDRQSTPPQLMRISEVDRNCDPTSPLGCVLNWIRGFLARPHPQLGRPGSVCPFVPIALGLDTIWMAEVAETTPSFERISAIITDYRNVFLETEPTSGPEAINKAFLVVFPSLGANGADGAAAIDKVQASLKRYFVEMGLMLGEFHAANESPGLRNPDFRPLRSPIPMLAIRHMVESDLPFLIRETYPPKERSSFLRSYLFRLGGELSQVKFNEAMDGLIAAEKAIALSIA